MSSASILAPLVIGGLIGIPSCRWLIDKILVHRDLQTLALVVVVRRNSLSRFFVSKQQTANFDRAFVADSG